MSSIQNRLYRLLRWSERYTKTDMVYLARGGFWSVVGQTAAILSTLAFAVTVGHLLPKDVYGTYKYIISIVAILSTFSLSGLSGAVFQSVARGYDGALYEGFWTNLRWSIAVFLGAFAFAVYYFLLHNDTLAFGILVGGCVSPFLASANLSASFLAAKKDFRRRAIYFDIIENIIPAALLIITITLTHNPALIACVYFFANTLVTLWIYRQTMHLYRPDPRKRDEGTLSYSKHLSAMGILSGIASNIDQVLLFHFVGPAQLAVYNFALAIPEQAKGPLKSLDQMMQAQFVNRDSGEIRGRMRHKAAWLLVLSVLLVIVYVVVAPFIYWVFFPNYLSAVHYSQLYALSYLGLALAPAGSYLTAKKKVRAQYLSNVFIAIFRIGALFVGVLYGGLLGVIIALIVVRIAGPMFNYVLYNMEDHPQAK